MRILYAAVEQQVPGTTGGSVHVAAVASGLHRLGHDVHALATPGEGGFPDDGVTWHAMRPPLGLRQLRLLRAGAVGRLARRLTPDVVMERYYNFGGEGMLAARRAGALGVLEVNAPVIDHPGALKRRLDRAVVLEPMRRWRDWQCRAAGLIVTPTASILPEWVPRERIVEIEWGADTDRFQPDAEPRPVFPPDPDRPVVVFAGAFRAWHGALGLVEAIRRQRERGDHRVRAVLIGDGPELPRVRAAAERLEDVRCIGAVPHAHVPGYLAAADVGAAPFDVAAHPPLALDFYWSPLKVFEYMAAGLPVVAPRIDRLASIVRHEVDGLLYDAADPAGLDSALTRLASTDLRRRLGASARRRAVERFGWAAHCARIADRMDAARA